MYSRSKSGWWGDFDEGDSGRSTISWPMKGKKKEPEGRDL